MILSLRGWNDWDLGLRFLRLSLWSSSVIFPFWGRSEFKGLH